VTLAKDFLETKNKRITLLGMSGVGKTHLAKLIGEEGDWFHFSGDYRIGAKHLKEEIIANIANKMSSNNWLKALLDNNSISVNSQVTFDNLEPISAFLGKVGNDFFLEVFGANSIVSRKMKPITLFTNKFCKVSFSNTRHP
jgi:ATPase subunit of ABC transporter with duplicated ATPase domains